MLGESLLNNSARKSSTLQVQARKRSMKACVCMSRDLWRSTHGKANLEAHTEHTRNTHAAHTEHTRSTLQNMGKRAFKNLDQF